MLFTETSLSAIIIYLVLVVIVSGIATKQHNTLTLLKNKLDNFSSYSDSQEVGG